MHLSPIEVGVFLPRVDKTRSTHFIKKERQKDPPLNLTDICLFFVVAEIFERIEDQKILGQYR